MDKVRDTLQAIQNIVYDFEGMFYVKDLQGHIVYANTTFANFFGKTPDVLVGTNYVSLGSEEEVFKARLKDYDAILSKSCIEYEQVVNKDGKDITLHVGKCVINDSAGKPFCIAVICDVVENKKKVTELLEKFKVFYEVK